MDAIPLIELKGEAGERGYQHGRALREEIGAFYERFIQDQHDASGGRYGEPDCLAYAAAHLPAGRAYAPDLVDEVDGIAQGAGVSFEQAFLLNCFDEVSCHGPALLTGLLHGCTALCGHRSRHPRRHDLPRPGLGHQRLLPSRHLPSGHA